MRILYVAQGFAPETGGVQMHVTRLATHLAGRHEIHVAALAAPGEKASVTVRDGVTIHRFPLSISATDLQVSARLLGFVRAVGRKFDIVHVHNYHAITAVAGLFAPARGLVFTPHYHGTGHKPLLRLLHAPYRPVGRAVLRRSRRVICVSSAEAELLRADFPEATERATVIPNGVDLDRLRRAEPFAVDGPTALVLGRLEPYKNFDAAIEAISHLPQEWTLRVLGDGSHRSQLEEVARGLNLEERVQFMGRVPEEDVSRWLRTADVVLSLSAHEAYGIVLAEALAAGATPVVTDIPSHREIVRQAGAAGAARTRLIPVDTAPAEIATVMQKDEPSGDGEPQLVDWAEVAERTERLYEDVVAGRT